ncbi:MAG: GNAT family N-acetyltransferase [Chloroflexi bacterium]|nr:GNAT family N-acetyltransferase [Chloroflexota bacterium]MBU1746047.1 GNAT family N-acetyltransferase [Chloroflexota bacterium]
MRVQQVSDPARLLGILDRERLYAAYAIGDLDPVMFPTTKWYVVEAHDVLALGLLFNGLSLPIIFTLGDVEGVTTILEQSLRPPTAYFNCRAGHLPAVTRCYELRERQEMWRMTLTAATFQPVATPERPQRLSVADLRHLNKLYEMAEAQAFAAYQVEQGVFYGLRVDGQLVATAGTHVISPRYGVGAVGNVFTHPAYRGHGYAAACTSAVVQDLIQLGCQDIVLNVNVHNHIAQHVYERLGFQRHCRYWEGIGQRRSPGLWARVKQHYAGDQTEKGETHGRT